MNVFDLWRDNNRQLPITVRRHGWKAFRLVVVRVEPRGPYYGRAFGYVVELAPNAQPWMGPKGSAAEPVELSNVGCHGWTIEEPIT